MLAQAFLEAVLKRMVCFVSQPVEGCDAIAMEVID